MSLDVAMFEPPQLADGRPYLTPSEVWEHPELREMMQRQGWEWDEARQIWIGPHVALRAAR